MLEISNSRTAPSDSLPFYNMMVQGTTEAFEQDQKNQEEMAKQTKEIYGTDDTQ